MHLITKSGIFGWIAILMEIALIVISSQRLRWSILYES